MRFVSSLTGLGVIGFFALGLAVLLPIEIAHAQSCSSIRAQLAGGGKSANRSTQRKYANAIRAQKQQLARVQAKIKQRQCKGPFRCVSLKNTARRMRANLAGLQAKSRSLGGSKGISRRQRNRLLALLQRRGCVGAKTQRVAVRKQAAPQRARTTKGFRAQGGDYRTLCVRTCDGYYFPISTATRRSNFKQDSARCAALCPSGNAQLYYHRVNGEESEDMVNLDGVPYTEMPKAFVYRQTKPSDNKQCGCGKPVLSALINKPKDRTLRQSAAKGDDYSPRPFLAPENDQLFETYAEQRGGLTKQAMADLLAPKFGTQTISEDEDIRVVGSEFLPDPEEAIDLQVPVQPLTQ